MKNVRILLVCIACIPVLSCQPGGNKTGDFNLVPGPQEFEISGASLLSPHDINSFYFDCDYDSCPDFNAGNLLQSGGDAGLPACVPILSDISPAADPAKAQIICRIDTSMDLRAEGYTLEISGKQIMITAVDRAGLLYAYMTLEQLMEDAEEQEIELPECSIRDYPLIPYRAVHLDLKHHREKKGYYFNFIDRLARYKVNAVIAEVEDKLGYLRQPEVASSDALSIEDWRDLSEYARERNIEISPLVQGLGHASFILKHERYKSLRDDPENDWAFDPLNPETYKVQFDLYLDAIEAMPYGRYLHIGGDEVETTGRNSGKTALELQLIWLDRVCAFADDHGRTPIFWDDMPLKHAGVYRPMFSPEVGGAEVDSIWEENGHKLLEFLDRFPENCVYMRWNYTSPRTAGNIRAMEWYRENGLKVMGATAGQRRWILMPQNESNIGPIRDFASLTAEMGGEGLLLTLWDDDSPHSELYSRGILSFAEYTWSGTDRTGAEVKSAYRHREFAWSLAGDEYAFIDRLEKAAEFWNGALLNKRRRNFLNRLDDPMTQAVIDLPDPENKGEWTEKHTGLLETALIMKQACDSIAETIARMKTETMRNLYALEVYEQVNQMAGFSSDALLALKAYDLAGDGKQEQEALQRIRQLPGEFESLRSELEKVYSQTRILEKPEGYLLDQDHHAHLANQAISFDWQFQAELLFLKKIQGKYQINL